MDLLVKSIMQPPSIGETDFTCSVVPVTGARENVTQINRRVVKRDSGNIISGAFICLFYMSIILQLAVEIKYKMSYNILIWA